MRRHSTVKVAPMTGSSRVSLVTRLRVTTVVTIRNLNPFAFRARRRRRRRSATTNEILTMQHATALSAASVRSQGHQDDARAVETLHTVHSVVDESRLNSMTTKATVDYLVGLATFFFVCDYNEDGALSRSEKLVLLEILLAQKPTHRTGRKRQRTGQERLREMVVDASSDDEDEELTLDEFIQQFGHTFYADGVRLPSTDLVERCRRLKNGFRRSDTNGDNVISLVELEIALQKLDLVFADEALEQLMKTLDSNGDGWIDWSEMVRAAWMNTHLGPTRNRNSVLLLDALADVPASAIVNHDAPPSRKSHGSMQGPSTHQPSEIGQRSRQKKKTKEEESTSLFTWLALQMHLFWRQDMDDDARVSTREELYQEPVQPRPKSRVEHVGVHILTRISMHQVTTMKRAILGRQRVAPLLVSHIRKSASTGSGLGPTYVSEAKPVNARPLRRTSTTVGRTRLSSSMRRRVVRIQWVAVAVAALVGVACGLLSMQIESFIPRLTNQDEFSGDASYFVYLISINVAVSLVEVNLMYLTAVVCAFRMTVVTRLTLYPQDAEREFLTRAIARAALQVGHSKHALFGMDPMKGSPRLVLWLSFLLFKSKRYVLKFLIKLFIRRVLWRAAAKTVLSALVLPINALLNGWTLRLVMRHCRVTIIGPPCITVLLEEFFRLHEAKLLPYQRVDYLRVLGCSLVCKRCVHPNLEIIVAQVRRRWVALETWPVSDGCSCLASPHEPCELHELDDVDRFLASLLLDSSRLTLPPTLAAAFPVDVPLVDHQRNMFFFLILALVVDGRLSLSEHRLYVRACQAANMVNDWPAVRRLKNQFMGGHGLSLESIFEMIVRRPRRPSAEGSREDELQNQGTPWMDVLLDVGDRISSVLSI